MYRRMYHERTDKSRRAVNIHEHITSLFWLINPRTNLQNCPVHLAVSAQVAVQLSQPIQGGKLQESIKKRKEVKD